MKTKIGRIILVILASLIGFIGFVGAHEFALLASILLMQFAIYANGK